MALLLQVTDAEAAKIRIQVETPGGVVQKVFLARPAGLAADRPVVFAMQGEQRNADDLRDQWYDLAEEHDFLLVVPEFSDADFAGASGYDFGNVHDEKGGVRPRSTWAFEAIEPIFDDVRRRFGMTAEGYAIYGHAAGAGFVHRFVMHVPEARVTRAVVANAGWYTMPDFSVDFPYGLRGSVVGEAQLRHALQMPLTILLGEAEPDEVTPAALAQGEHPLARGQAFLRTARSAAAERGVPFGWQLATVPEVGHDSELMAPAAIPYLLP